MFYPMRGAMPSRRYASPHDGRPTYGLLDALNWPELVRVSDVSQPDAAPPAEGAGISPLRWLAGQVGLLDVLGATDAAAHAPVATAAPEPDEPSWFDRTAARFRETFPPVPPPEMVRDGKGGVWRKDIYDLIEDIAVAGRKDEAALRRRIQDVLVDAPLTRDRWFHYELSNRLDGDDPETIRTALRDWGHEEAIQTREVLSQLLPGIALAGKAPFLGSRQSSADPSSSVTSKQNEFRSTKPAPLETTGSNTSVETATSVAPVRRSNRTRFGVKRDSNADWRTFRQQWDEVGYGETLSATNRSKIDDGLAPVVDETWVKYFPEDAGLLGQKIEVHHIDGLAIRLPWPHTRHMDAHRPRGPRWNHGGPGSAAPFYPRRQRDD
jgi:hypothetical protein